MLTLADTVILYAHVCVQNKSDIICGFVFSRVALDRAAVLLTMKREMVRLDNVWGVGGGQRPVKHLIKEVSSGQTCRILRIFKKKKKCF